jgi:hypothetical protein
MLKGRKNDCASIIAHRGSRPPEEPSVALEGVSASTGGGDEIRLAKPHNSAKYQIWWPLAVGLIALALWIPFMREVWWFGDEGDFLDAADRMLRGDTIYVDFFEFLPPGGFLITKAWLSVVGISMLSARTLAILTISAISVFTFLACWRVSKHAPFSAFISVSWILVSQVRSLELNHHWFTTLLSMIAAWAVLTILELSRPRLRWAMAAGIAAGAAVMVTPHRGILAVAAGATGFLNLRRYSRELMIYLFGTTVIPFLMLAYLAHRGALAAAFDDVILFTASHYYDVNRVPFGLWAPIELWLLFPLAATAAVVTWAGDRRDAAHFPIFRTCAAFCMVGFMGSFPRSDQTHLAYSAPLACPLLAYCAGRITWRLAPIYRYLAGAAAMAFLFPSLHSYEWWARDAWQRQIVQTPRGGVMLASPGAPELLARIAATPLDNRYFFYPNDALLAFLAARPQVSRYGRFVPGYTPRPQYQEACASAMRDALWVVIDRSWADPKYLMTIFPAMHDPEPPETRKFEQALETGFDFVAREGVYELRRRVPEVDETICSGIAG